MNGVTAISTSRPSLEEIYIRVIGDQAARGLRAETASSRRPDATKVRPALGAAKESGHLGGGGSLSIP